MILVARDRPPCELFGGPNKGQPAALGPISKSMNWLSGRDEKSITTQNY